MFREYFLSGMDTPEMPAVRTQFWGNIPEWFAPSQPEPWVALFGVVSGVQIT